MTTDRGEQAMPQGNLMTGKRGLIMGVANNRSIAWGISKAVAAQGAEVALTYHGDALKKRVEPLAAELGSTMVLPCDVTDAASMDAVFATLKEKWGRLDFLVHAIAFSDKTELTGRFVDTSRDNFKNSLDISCYSFIDVAARAAPMMPEGGSLMTLTYMGSHRVQPNYNVMGVAKAALEASVRYLANDLGPEGIRVNAISAGAMRTLSLAGIRGGKSLMGTGKDWSLLKEDTRMEGVAGCALYLLSPLGHSIAGEVLHVDAGFHAVGVPDLPEG